MPSTRLRARWIAPVSGPPIENGVVVIERNRVVEVTRATMTTESTTDFGDALIVPGFVNAHTHLMLAGCQGSVPFTGSFVGWIETLMARSPGGRDDETIQRAIREGARQSLAAGVTTIADIAGPPALTTWPSLTTNISGLVEVMGITESHRQRFADTRSVRAATAMIERHKVPPGTDSLHRVGLSPHAPYSADASVYRDAINYCNRTNRLLTTHLAETRDELQFLADGTGPFRDFLETLDLWDGTFTPPACSPVEYASQLGLLDGRCLFAHVNYATDADLDLLARHDTHVAFCPRSHRFFGHEPHRWRDMLARGINVCVGTDSLASNDSLSVLDELRFLRAQEDAIAGAELLSMGTRAGARALRLDEQIGSLAPGLRVDLVVVPLSDPNTSDPVEDLLRSTAAPVTVCVGGRVAT